MPTEFVDQGWELWAWYRADEWQPESLHRFWHPHRDQAEHAARTLPKGYIRYEIKKGYTPTVTTGRNQHAR